MASNKSDSINASSPQVYIYGPLKLQNELIGWYLKSNCGVSCIDISNAEFKKLLTMRQRQKFLILLDCLGGSPASQWSKIREIAEAEGSQCMAALFNVTTDHRIRSDLVNCGIRGVFFDKDPVASLSKGVNAILEGELWFSRELLVKCLFESRDAEDDVESAEEAGDGGGTFLTLREKEILIMISSGVSNRKIASYLGISTNTVKTHVYHIYNKINVPNRLQAALWAAKYL